MQSIAIVGFGNIGAKHAAAIAKAQHCRLTAIVDPLTSRAEEPAARGVPFFADVAQMLAAARPDGVIIATHTQAHVDVAMTCVEAGLPCLVEKPFAVTVANARTVLDAAKRKGIPLLTGHHRRYNPLVQKAHALIHDGTLGELVGVSGMWALRKHDSYYETAWRTKPGAGPILTNIIHDIDSLRYICGEVDSIMAITSNAVRGHVVEDSASVTIAFQGGALGSFLITDAGNSPWAWEVNSAENPDYPVMDQNTYLFTGTEAALGFPRLTLWRHAPDGERHWFRPMRAERLELPWTDPLVLQAEHFAAVIRGEAKPRVSGSEGARTLACIEAIFESAKSGRRVQPDFDCLN